MFWVKIAGYSGELARDTGEEDLDEEPYEDEDEEPARR
jgi:hypothetical protein